MGIQKCKRCKKVFAAVQGAKICPNCLREEEDQFVLVKDYLWEHPGATIKELHEATEVEERIIKKFVKEGRFLQINGVDITVECERCGTAIRSGRFCEDCSQKLQNGISKVKKVSDSKEELKEDKDRMFLGDRIKRR
ncbi:flagellar protein [Orenia marismortui]|uniref:Flagellar operon protein (TIGR03826 family) n=1 Tax=Orenia marismortui TaxID=46469 RepID=A0A4R8HQ87_9FIRM|nr:flagellar protein [Orenia marismortui]TDX58893.1 flagellar operon protein (TIGR03826 family) [Orenia marismortui]